jgi:hypothetical protein
MTLLEAVKDSCNIYYVYLKTNPSIRFKRDGKLKENLKHLLDIVDGACYNEIMSNDWEIEKIKKKVILDCSWKVTNGIIHPIGDVGDLRRVIRKQTKMTVEWEELL